MLVVRSVLAFAVERAFTVFGAYIIGGLCIMLVPLFDAGLTHLAFRATVYWTVSMSAVWFAEKAMTTCAMAVVAGVDGANSAVMLQGLI